MTPDEILAQAQSAALDARDMLSWKKPQTKVGSRIVTISRIHSVLSFM